MKTKPRSKTLNRKVHTRITKTKNKARPAKSPRTGNKAPSQTPSRVLDSEFKSCQEVEVGDIGGFGSAEELEQHQKQCGDRATEFCTTCGKSLCHIHYMLLHGHDDSYKQNTGQGLVR